MCPPLCADPATLSGVSGSARLLLRDIFVPFPAPVKASEATLSARADARIISGGKTGAWKRFAKRQKSHTASGALESRSTLRALRRADSCAMCRGLESRPLGISRGNGPQAYGAPVARPQRSRLHCARCPALSLAARHPPPADPFAQRMARPLFGAAEVPVIASQVPPVTNAVLIAPTAFTITECAMRRKRRPICSTTRSLRA